MSIRSPFAPVILALTLACGGSSAPPPTPPGPPPPAPSAAESRVSLSSGSVAADGVTPAQVTVVVRDGQGEAIAGVPVTISYAGEATPEQGTVVTDASGAATFRLTASAPTSGAVTATVAAETPVVREAPAELAFHGCAGAFSNGACVPPPWIALPPATPTSVVQSDIHVAATGDLDGNGCDDLVVASQDVATLEVHLGLCDGTFAPPALHDFNGQNATVSGLVVADLDGDAVLDVATYVSSGLAATSGLRVLRGLGDGTLAPPTTYSGLYPPVGVADVDGDGDLDLLDGSGANVRILVNDGHAAFSVGGTVATGAAPGAGWAVRPGDMDGDGHVDLVVALKSVGKVAVLRGNGDGTFAAPLTFDAPVNQTFALADFDRDGRLDVLTLHTTGAEPGVLSLLRGNGDGTLAAPVSFETTESAQWLATGDVDGDGAPDAAVLGNGVPLTISRSRGDGTFAPAVAYDVKGSVFSSLTLGKLDRDGKADVVVSASAVVRTVMGGGAGGLDATPTLPVQCYGGVATGDVDGDGVPDVACAEALSGGAGVVYVALGLGGGLFMPAVPYASGTGPKLVAIADLDRDGYGDVVVANGSSDYTVTTFRGAADGVLVRAGTFRLPAGNPSGLVVADVDRDELPDAIVSSSSISTVSLLRGVGDGTFTVEALPAAFAPYGAALGDLDADGDPDLVLVRPNPPRIAVLENAGGSFSPAVEFPAGPAGTYAYAASLADLDGNGRLDVVVCDAWVGQVRVLLATGPRTFGPAVSYAVGTEPSAIATGDVNADGHVDVVAADRASDFVTVLLGKGDGTLAEGPRYVGADARSLVVSDVNGDGAGDVVAALGQTLRIYPGGAGASPGASPVIAGANPVGVAAGDLDRDGALDLVVIGGDARDWIAVALGTGAGKFAPPTAIPSLDYAYGVAVVDLNGDGALDVVTSHANPGLNAGSIGVLLGKGDGTFQPQVTYPAGMMAWRSVVADVNGDDKLDVLLDFGSYLPGDGAGRFGAVVRLTGVVPSDDVVVADLNGDGKLDLATADQSTSEVATYLGDGAGGFVAKSKRTVNQAKRLVAADFDGDGKLDLGVAGMSFWFLRGNGDGTIAPPVEGPANWGSEIVATDLDLDGRPDVALTTQSDAIVLLHGQGDGTFETSAWRIGLVPVDLAVADLDGDGRPDLAALTASGVFPLLSRQP